MKKEHKKLEVKMNSESGALIKKVKDRYKYKIKYIQSNFENKLNIKSKIY